MQPKSEIDCSHEADYLDCVAIPFQTILYNAYQFKQPEAVLAVFTQPSVLTGIAALIIGSVPQRHAMKVSQEVMAVFPSTFPILVSL